MNNIHIIRKELGLNIVEFGELLGVSTKKAFDLEKQVSIKHKELQNIYEKSFNLNFLCNDTEQIYRTSDKAKDIRLQEIFFRLDKFFKSTETTDEDKDKISGVINALTKRHSKQNK